MENIEIKTSEVVALHCDACYKKITDNEFYAYKLNLRTPSQTHFHIHEICLANLINDNRGIYEKKEVYKI